MNSVNPESLNDPKPESDQGKAASSSAASPIPANAGSSAALPVPVPVPEQAPVAASSGDLKTSGTLPSEKGDPVAKLDYTYHSSKPERAVRDLHWRSIHPDTLELCAQVFVPPNSLKDISESQASDWLKTVGRVIRITGDPQTGRTFTAYWLAWRLLSAVQADKTPTGYLTRIHVADRWTTDEAIQSLIECPPRDVEPTCVHIVFEDACSSGEGDRLHEDRMTRLRDALHKTARLILIGSGKHLTGISEFSTAGVLVSEVLGRHVKFERNTPRWCSVPEVLDELEQLCIQGKLAWLKRPAEVPQLLWRLREIRTKDDLIYQMPAIELAFRQAAVTRYWYEQLGDQAKLMALMAASFPWMNRQEIESHVSRLVTNHENFGRSREAAHLGIVGDYLQFTDTAFGTEAREQLEGDYVRLLPLVGKSVKGVSVRVRKCLESAHVSPTAAESAGRLLGRLGIHQWEWLEAALETALGGQYQPSVAIPFITQVLGTVCDADSNNITWACRQLHRWSVQSANGDAPIKALATWACLGTIASQSPDAPPKVRKIFWHLVLRATGDIVRGLPAESDGFTVSTERFRQFSKAANACMDRYPEWVCRKLCQLADRTTASESRAAVKRLKDGDVPKSRRSRTALRARMARDTAWDILQRRAGHLPPQFELMELLKLLPVLLEDSMSRTQEVLWVIRNWLEKTEPTLQDRDKIIGCLLEACDLDEHFTPWISDVLLDSWLASSSPPVAEAAEHMMVRLRALRGASFDLPNAGAGAFLFAAPTSPSDRHWAGVVITAVARAMRGQMDLLVAPLEKPEEPEALTAALLTHNVTDLPNAVPLLVPALEKLIAERSDVAFTYFLCWQAPPDLDEAKMLNWKVPLTGVLTNTVIPDPASLEFLVRRIFDWQGALVEELYARFRLLELMGRALNDMDQLLFQRLWARTADEWWSLFQTAVSSNQVPAADRATAILELARRDVPSVISDANMNGMLTDATIRHAVCCFVAAYRCNPELAVQELTAWLGSEMRNRKFLARIAGTAVVMIAAHQPQVATLVPVFPLLPKLAEARASIAIVRVLAFLRQDIDTHNRLPGLDTGFPSAVTETLRRLPRRIAPTKAVMAELWRIGVPTKARRGTIPRRPPQIREFSFRAMCDFQMARIHESRTPFDLLAEAAKETEGLCPRLIVLVASLSHRSPRMATTIANFVAEWFNGLSDIPTPDQGVLLFIAGSDMPLRVDGQRVTAEAILKASHDVETNGAGSPCLIPSLVASLPKTICRLRLLVGNQAAKDNPPAAAAAAEADIVDRTDEHTLPPSDLLKSLLRQEVNP